MPDNAAAFQLIFKTIADATGITAMGNSLEGLNRKIESFKGAAEKALALVGLGLTIRELNELGNKALEVREKQAVFTEAILRSKDGSHQLVEELMRLNEELEKTTGTDKPVSRAIEQQLATTRLSGEQIVRLTPAIINFAAVTNQSAESVADMLSKRLRGAVNDTDLSLTKFGITARDTEGIIRQVAAIGGDAAGKLVQASGGMKRYDQAVEDLHISLGNLVNLVRIPFLTEFAASTEGARTSIDDATKSYTKFGETIYVTSATAAAVIVRVPQTFTEAAKVIYFKAGELVYSVSDSIAQALKITTHAIELAVVETTTALDSLVKATADITARLSGGAIKIDTSGINDELGKITKGALDAGKAIIQSLGGAQISKGLADWKSKADEAWNALDRLLKEPDKAGEAAKKAYADFANFFNNLQGKAGAGVVPPGIDPSAAHKEAEAALTEVKYRLTAAQQQYEIELEKTQELETNGAISVQQADEQRRAAITDYISKLSTVQQMLPLIISRMEALGETKAVDELKLISLEIDKIRIKEEQAFANTTFFGKIRSQLVQLKNEWSDLGKTIGGFLTNQFQNFASTAGNLIGQLVIGTGNWKQAILGVIQSFVSGLATMVIQWVLARTVISALNKAFGSADAEAIQAQGQAAAKAWAPGAVAASIASYGAAAGAGLIAYLSAIGVGTAGTIAASAGGGGGFAEGGVTPDRPTMAMVSEEGPEFVFSNPAVRHFGVDFLRSLHNVGISRPSGGGGSAGGGSFGAGGASLGGKTEIFVLFDEEELHRRLRRSTANNKHIVRVVNGAGGNLRT